eukprot:781580_1
MPEWRQNLINYAKQDINAKRNEYLFPAPEWLGTYLGIEPRDNALWYNVFNCLVLITINLLALPFLMNAAWYYIALLSLIRIVLIGVPKFILALHFSFHLAIIKPLWLNSLLIEYIITPFFGLPPGVYRFHHVIMHHKEDNIYPFDLSSTMPYNRGNFPWCYLHYWARFEFATWFELPYYLLTKKYYQMFLQSICAIIVWFSGNYFIYMYIRPAFALWLFLIPQFILSMALMWGNFGQHIFIDPAHYRDDHRLTVNLLATPYNQLTFNDGYHIIHHKYPRCHWSEMPKRFITDKELNLHEKNDSICVKDIDYFMLAAYVWFGFYEKLVKQHFVPCNQKQADMNINERIKFLKGRLLPIQNEQYYKGTGLFWE